ncbi:hypothetical protein JCGZ_11179 [Jatropha curcas]|uniref:Uncharacterized protein n=1 Tax=Jatropha curcas TaxID=180498 RepID=A0A067KFC8_JATCU|nr:hypothetical protein JCGZ_11179 [Jatropha curcas]
MAHPLTCAPGSQSPILADRYNPHTTGCIPIVSLKSRPSGVHNRRPPCGQRSNLDHQIARSKFYACRIGATRTGTASGWRDLTEHQWVVARWHGGATRWCCAGSWWLETRWTGAINPAPLDLLSPGQIGGGSTVAQGLVLLSLPGWNKEECRAAATSDDGARRIYSIWWIAYVLLQLQVSQGAGRRKKRKEKKKKKEEEEMAAAALRAGDVAGGLTGGAENGEGGGVRGERGDKRKRGFLDDLG